MSIVSAIGASLISAGTIFGLAFFLKKQAGSSTVGRMKDVLIELEAISAKIKALDEIRASSISIEQSKWVKDQLDETKVNLQAQKDTLKDIESKLDVAQKAIEEKEILHQEVKSAKAEDEEKLQQILGRFEEISTESITLEQKLAASMKNLDTMMTEVKLTPDQKAVMDDLSSSLTSAGGRLRDLITEYETSKGRLETLERQLDDLEEEYTRLVEQQLGE